MNTHRLPVAGKFLLVEVAACLASTPVFSAQLAPADRAAEIDRIFQPFATECAALAPDGRHLAYELHRGNRLFLTIVDLTNRHAVELPLTSDLPEMLSGISEAVPTRLTDLAWSGDNRVVAIIRESVVVGADADGSHFKTLLDRAILREHTGYLRDRFAFESTNLTRAAANLITEPRALRPRDSMFPSDSDFGRSYHHSPFGSDFSRSFFDDFSQREAFSGQALASGTADLFDEGRQADSGWGRSLRLAHVFLDGTDRVIIEARDHIDPLADLDVQRSGLTSVSNLTLDTRSGRVLHQDDETYAIATLCDQQGRPRVKLLPATDYRSFEFAARPGSAFRRLDPKTATALSTNFTIRSHQFFGPRSIPLGFGADPDVLYYASNVGRDTSAILALNLATRADTGFRLEIPDVDFVPTDELTPTDVLVVDRFTHRLAGARYDALRRRTFWLDPTLADLQRRLDAIAEGMTVQIVDWDRARQTFLLRVDSQSNPGSFMVLDGATGKISSFADRAPGITADQLNTSEPFAFTAADGHRVTGYLTRPRDERIRPTPVLIYAHDGPWSRDLPGYDRGAQALATMGFAVLQVNYRGSAGFGRAYLDSLRGQGETPAIDDLLCALDWVQTRHDISRTRVAILGNGYGGYLALRAAELHPDRFRCVVSINAPANLPRWLEEPRTAFSFNRDIRAAFFSADRDALRAASPVAAADRLGKPVLIVQADRDELVPEVHARDLRRALKNAGLSPQFVALAGEGHARWLPGTYRRVFTQLEDFFNLNIYDFHVNLGESEIVQ